MRAVEFWLTFVEGSGSGVGVGVGSGLITGVLDPPPAVGCPNTSV